MGITKIMQKIGIILTVSLFPLYSLSAKDVDIKQNAGWESHTSSTRSLESTIFHVWTNNNWLYIECSSTDYDLTITIVDDSDNSVVYAAKYLKVSCNYIAIPMETWANGYYTLFITNNEGGEAVGQFCK
jgi:hypothetical protein